MQAVQIFPVDLSSKLIFSAALPAVSDKRKTVCFLTFNYMGHPYTK